MDIYIYIVYYTNFTRLLAMYFKIVLIYDTVMHVFYNVFSVEVFYCEWMLMQVLFKLWLYE